MEENIRNDTGNLKTYSSSSTISETNRTKSNSPTNLSMEQIVINIDHNQTDSQPDSPAPLNSHSNKEHDSLSNIFNKEFVKQNIVKVVAIMIFHIYLAYATYHHYSNGIQWHFCEGLGFLMIIVAFSYLYIIISVILNRFGRQLHKFQIAFRSIYSSRPLIGKASYIIVIIGIVIFLVFDTKNDRRRLVSAGGILALLLIAFIFSNNRRQIDWRQVTCCLLLQLIFGIVILRWKPGKLFFECIGQKVDHFLSFTDVGSSFIYGPLITQQPFLPQRLPNDSIAFNVTSMVNDYRAAPVVVVFKALSVIYFFSFVVNMLFYLGYIQSITLKIGSLLRSTIGTSTIESVSAAANIFLGQAMTPLLVAPYIKDLTMSELHAAITGGFATIAGTTMAAYISFGISAAHLLSASVMSAPAALACAKILYPETEVSKTNQNIKLAKHGNGDEVNIIDAATRGASSAAMIVMHITAIVIACIAFVAFLNSLVTYAGSLVGFDETFTFEWILGKVFIPLAYIMGVQWKDCEVVGVLIGIKTVVNEFIAYRRLGLLVGQLNPRTISITTYALCGYANPGSIGIQLATFGAICPERMADYSSIILRAFLGGSIACFMTACIAGTLIETTSEIA